MRGLSAEWAIAEEFVNLLTGRLLLQKAARAELASQSASAGDANSGRIRGRSNTRIFVRPCSLRMQGKSSQGVVPERCFQPVGSGDARQASRHAQRKRSLLPRRFSMERAPVLTSSRGAVDSRLGLPGSASRCGHAPSGCVGKRILDRRRPVSLLASVLL
jgi:hypothetical protein